MATATKKVPARKKAARAPMKKVKAAARPAPPPKLPKAAAAPAARPAKADKDKGKKPKLVRDSYTIPKPEYAVLEQLKLRAVRLGRPAKKSELLRAGLKALAAMEDAGFVASVALVPALKTGRPAKH